MPDPASRSPLSLGDIVRRSSDSSTSAFGYVVGVILTDPELVLVRWRGSQASFEVVDSLVALIDTLQALA